MPAKLIRKLPELELQYPVQIYKPGTTCKPGPKAPTMFAMEFICLLEDLAQTPKKMKFALFEKHNELFGFYPNAGVQVEVVRARCIYRLQYEGHRISGVTPSPKFLQNYRAIMQFNEEQPWNGCTEQVSELGKRLALSRGEVSMSAVKKTASVAKKAAKTAKGDATPAAPASKREVILGDLSITETIRYMAKVMDAGARQIEATLKKLGVQKFSMATIHAQSHRVRSGILKAPSLKGEQIAAIKKACPAEDALPKVVRAAKAETKPTTPSPVAKKVVKVIKKVAPKTEGETF